MACGGNEAKIWVRKLYNCPVRSVIDYFILNLKGSSDIVDKESSVHLKHKLEIKVGNNEEAINNVAEF